MHVEPTFAAIVQRPGILVDELLASFTRELTDHGVRVRGLIQHNGAVVDGCACTMDLVDVASGRRFRISQDLGAGSTSCRIDAAGVAAASITLRHALTDDADLIVANRYGGLEKAGGGLYAEMLQAMASGIPFLTVVPQAHLDDWREFSGGLGRLLPPEPAALHRWFAETHGATTGMAAAAS